MSVDLSSTNERGWSSRGVAAGWAHRLYLGWLRVAGPQAAHLVLPLVVLFFVLFRRGRIASARPVLDAVLGASRNSRERWVRDFKHALTFGRCQLDQAIMLVHGPSALRFETEGQENFDSACSAGTGAIVLSAHFGNYPVGAGALGESGIPVTVVMLEEESEHIREHYRRNRNPQLTPPKIIDVGNHKHPGLEILSALRRGGTVALTGDRLVDGAWTELSFLGGAARFPLGPYQLAAAAHTPVVLTMVIALGPRHYRLVMEKPRRIEVGRRDRQSRLAEEAAWFVGRLEHYVKGYPYQWSNFFDFYTEPALSEPGNSH